MNAMLNTKKIHIGGTAIVAGTSIGAGMLALPLVSFQLGYFLSALLLVLTMLLMTAAALLLVDLCSKGGKTRGIATVAHEGFGKIGGFIAILSQFLLFQTIPNRKSPGLDDLRRCRQLLW